jgi:hypothetical protein
MQVVENGCAVAGSDKPEQQRVSVKRGEPTLVPPAEPTPTGERYYLSNLDQNIAVIVQTVYCYKGSSDVKEDDAAAVLRDALARVLVHYHPLAGRLGISPEMKLTVELTGDGALFVEADAACDLADVGDLTKPDPAALGQLVYSVPGAKNILEMPPMTAQVRTAITDTSICRGDLLGCTTRGVNARTAPRNPVSVKGTYPCARATFTATTAAAAKGVVAAELSFAGQGMGVEFNSGALAG